MVIIEIFPGTNHQIIQSTLKITLYLFRKSQWEVPPIMLVILRSLTIFLQTFHWQLSPRDRPQRPTRDRQRREPSSAGMMAVDMVLFWCRCSYYTGVSTWEIPRYMVIYASYWARNVSRSRWRWLAKQRYQVSTRHPSCQFSDVKERLIEKWHHHWGMHSPNMVNHWKLRSCLHAWALTKCWSFWNQMLSLKFKSVHFFQLKSFFSGFFRA